MVEVVSSAGIGRLFGQQEAVLEAVLLAGGVLQPESRVEEGPKMA